MKGEKGQSMIEIVFAIGIIVTVLAGIAALLVSSLHSRTSGYDRKKAAELGQKVIEKLIEESRQNPATFWNNSSSFWSSNIGVVQTMAGFANYSYTIGMTQVVNVGASCRPAVFECAETTVRVGWSGAGTGEGVTFTRFFAK